MAAVVEMGEVDDVHPKDDNVSEGVVMNGEVDSVQDDVSTKSLDQEESMYELMEVDKEDENDDDEILDENREVLDEDENEDGTDEADQIEGSVEDDNEAEAIEDAEVIEEDEDDKEEGSEEGEEKTPSQADSQDDQAKSLSNGEADEEISHVIDSEDDIEMTSTISDDDDKSSEKQNGGVNENGTDDEKTEAVVINDENKNDDDVMIVEDVKENGDPKVNKPEIIDLETPIKVIAPKKEITPRRSGRNVRKSKHYILDDKSQSGESDIEEVLPDDPLAVVDPLGGNDKGRKKISRAVPIVVKDTKRLVEIASKSTNNSTKKEPTLVIIDTNSILSGRGPVPVSQKQSTYSMLPVALPAQGMYSPNMRATITPIPISTKSSSSSLPIQVQPAPAPQPQILPSLTDDMFVVEAPSFIVPYVYEKPPVKDLKDFIKTMADEIKRLIKEDEDKEDQEDDKDSKNDESDEEIKKEKNEKMEVDSDDKKDDIKKEKPHTFFDSPIGKFFVEIGSNLVQEFVQTDLLKQQKRKREREGGQNSSTNKTIQSLIKGLEYTKENNQHYKMSSKRCEFCNYKTESALAMAFHLETPHMKNFIYRCNFCSYEVRNPHDILFHMEAEHCVRGRLERAPAFHQCPNCAFEDNQKGKLSRHSVACARKFKPERNMEPPIDWEPPAKIPRAPRMKQTGLSTTAAMYQAMAKSSIQYMKMQQNAVSQQAANRGRGRPSLTVSSGSSVLVPTNYQISGNQLYQVLGGQDIASRIGGPMGLIPNMSSTSSTVSTQNQTSNKSKPVHQPSISITPLPRGSSNASATVSPPSTGVIPPPAGGGIKPGDCLSKNSFVICEICDGYIKDLEQLRNHMQWIHKVKIHPKMIYNRPPLNCQKCQFRFFTDQGLERHLLGSHGLVTSSMQEAANKCKDSGRCPVCGRVYQWKLLNHVARDHGMTLKPAHLSYKCTVCTATFGMYKQFENHVYSAHSVVAKRSMDKKGSNTSSPSTPKSESLKPLKINDEITIIPQMGKSNGASSSKEGSPSTSSRNTTKIGETSLCRADRPARRNTSLVEDK